MTLEKFFAIINGIQPDEKGCMIWPHGKNSEGYSILRLNNVSSKGHRLSLQRKLGREIKKGMCALHKCDNPSCVNPEHLWEGTKAQNNQDRAKKLRSCRKFGKDNHNHRSVIELNSKIIFNSTCEAARYFNVWQANLVKCCQGKIKQTGGYKFSYLERKLKNMDNKE